MENELRTGYTSGRTCALGKFRKCPDIRSWRLKVILSNSETETNTPDDKYLRIESIYIPGISCKCK